MLRFLGSAFSFLCVLIVVGTFLAAYTAPGREILITIDRSREMIFELIFIACGLPLAIANFAQDLISCGMDRSPRSISSLISSRAAHELKTWQKKI